MSGARCAGAVLAGGASRRMGTAKGELLLDGVTLAQRAVAILRRLTPLVVQCGGEPHEGISIDILPDGRPAAGPAAGIEAALRCFDVPVAVLAVDLPFVPVELLEEALQAVERGAAACAPHWRGRWHTLCGVYSPDGLGPLARRLDRGDADLQGLLQDIGTPLKESGLRSFGDPDRLLFNINTPEDLEKARRVAIS